MTMTGHFSAAQIAALSAPLDRSHVRTRKQAGRSVSYIEGWHAIAEANRIFGHDGWTSETVDLRMVAEGDRTNREGRHLCTCSYIARCRITVYAGARTLTREGVGAGHGMDEDRGLAHEKAVKEAETDARKRALMTFGHPFGLALYDRSQSNVSDGPTDDAAPPPPERTAAPPAPAAAPPSPPPPPSPPRAAPGKPSMPAAADPKAAALAAMESMQQKIAVTSATLRDELLLRLEALHEAVAAPNFAELKRAYSLQRSRVWRKMSDDDRRTVMTAEAKVGRAREMAAGTTPTAPAGVYDPETGEVTEAA